MVLVSMSGSARSRAHQGKLASANGVEKGLTAQAAQSFGTDAAPMVRRITPAAEIALLKQNLLMMKKKVVSTSQLVDLYSNARDEVDAQLTRANFLETEVQHLRMQRDRLIEETRPLRERLAELTASADSDRELLEKKDSQLKSTEAYIVQLRAELDELKASTRSNEIIVQREKAAQRRAMELAKTNEDLQRRVQQMELSRQDSSSSSDQVLRTARRAVEVLRKVLPRLPSSEMLALEVREVIEKATFLREHSNGNIRKRTGKGKPSSSSPNEAVAVVEQDEADLFNSPNPLLSGDDDLFDILDAAVACEEGESDSSSSASSASSAEETAAPAKRKRGTSGVKKKNSPRKSKSSISTATTGKRAAKRKRAASSAHVGGSESDEEWIGSAPSPASPERAVTAKTGKRKAPRRPQRTSARKRRRTASLRIYAQEEEEQGPEPSSGPISSTAEQPVQREPLELDASPIHDFAAMDDDDLDWDVPLAPSRSTLQESAEKPASRSGSEEVTEDVVMNEASDQEASSDLPDPRSDITAVRRAATPPPESVDNSLEKELESAPLAEKAKKSRCTVPAVCFEELLEQDGSRPTGLSDEEYASMRLQELLQRTRDLVEVLLAAGRSLTSAARKKDFGAILRVALRHLQHKTLSGTALVSSLVAAFGELAATMPVDSIERTRLHPPRRKRGRVSGLALEAMVFDIQEQLLMALVWQLPAARRSQPLWGQLLFGLAQCVLGKINSVEADSDAHRHLCYISSRFMQLCKAKGFLEEARVLCYEIVREGEEVDVPLLAACVEAWRLPLAAEKSGVAGRVIQFLVEQQVGQYGTEVDTLQEREVEAAEKLARSCNWDCEVDLGELVMDIETELRLRGDKEGDAAPQFIQWRASPVVFSATKALELLAAHQGWDWTYNELIVARLMPLLSPDGEEWLMAAVLLLTGSLVRTHIQINDAENLPGMDVLRSRLAMILDKENLSCFSKLVQQVAAKAILDMSGGRKDLVGPAREWARRQPAGTVYYAADDLQAIQ